MAIRKSNNFNIRGNQTARTSKLDEIRARRKLNEALNIFPPLDTDQAESADCIQSIKAIALYRSHSSYQECLRDTINNEDLTADARAFLIQHIVLMNSGYSEEGLVRFFEYLQTKVPLPVIEELKFHGYVRCYIEEGHNYYTLFVIDLPWFISDADTKQIEADFVYYDTSIGD